MAQTQTKACPNLYDFTLTEDTDCQLWHGTARRLDQTGTLDAGTPLKVEIRWDVPRELRAETVYVRDAKGYRYQVTLADLRWQGFSEAAGYEANGA